MLMSRSRLVLGTALGASGALLLWFFRDGRPLPPHHPAPRDPATPPPISTPPTEPEPIAREPGEQEAGPPPTPVPSPGSPGQSGQSVDGRGWPIDQAAFLHFVMGRQPGANLISGQSTFYQFDLDEFLRNQPEDVQARARAIREELLKAIADYDTAARELEREQWRVRYEDYRHAIDAGDFSIVETTGLTMEDSAHKIAEQREALALGELNRDYVYLVSSARPPNGADILDGSFSAIVYVPRSRYPRSFELMDEISRIIDAEEDTVRARLGIPR